MALIIFNNLSMKSITPLHVSLKLEGKNFRERNEIKSKFIHEQMKVTPFFSAWDYLQLEAPSIHKDNFITDMLISTNGHLLYDFENEMRIDTGTGWGNKIKVFVPIKGKFKSEQVDRLICNAFINPREGIDGEGFYDLVVKYKKKNTPYFTNLEWGEFE